MYDVTGVSVRHSIVGTAERKEIDYNTSMHTHGAQSSKYIGVTTDGMDAKRYAIQKASFIRKGKYKAELKGGGEWSDLPKNNSIRDENSFGGIKFYTSDIVNHK